MGRFGHSGDWLRCNAKQGLSHPNWMHLSRNNPHVDCLSSKKSTYAVNWVVNLSHSLAESVFRAVTSWRTLPGCSGLCWSSEGFTKQVHLPRPITYHDTPLWFSKGQANRESKLLTRISYFLFPFKLPYPPQCRGAHLHYGLRIWLWLYQMTEQPSCIIVSQTKLVNVLAGIPSGLCTGGVDVAPTGFILHTACWDLSRRNRWWLCVCMTCVCCVCNAHTKPIVTLAWHDYFMIQAL